MGNSNVEIKSCGCGTAVFAATFVLVLLKLFGLIEISWWLVFSALGLYVLGVVILAAIVLVVAFIAAVLRD